jgi:predicted secreted Zn-dependent protease
MKPNYGWKATNGKLTITYRFTTRTESAFPAVDVRWNRNVKPLTGLKSQRVHFLGGIGK